MKKSIVLLFIICITLLFASCGISVNSGKSADISGQSTAAGTATEAQAENNVTSDDNNGQIAEAETSQADSPNASNTSDAPDSADTSNTSDTGKDAKPEEPADTGLTLEGIKKAAQESGYSVEAINERQMSGEPRPTDGFNLIYTDEYSQSNIPVFEFKDANDARAYAKQVNEKGYYLCIVSGKFLTMTNARYGVNINDNEMKLLETLLESRVMQYEEASPAVLPLAKDFAGAYLNREVIYKALDRLINRSVLLHDKSAPEGERISESFVTFSPLSSGDLAFVADLSEDQARLDAIVEFWERLGVEDMKLMHEEANDYILTGSRMGLDTAFEIHCSFAPETGSLRLIDKDGGEVMEFYEFVPLGGDKYAFQTLYERAIVEYKGGKISSFIYSLNTRDKAYAYNPDSDSIYGKSGGIDEAWASKAGEDKYEQFISFDGTTLKIAADSFAGTRLKIELKPQ